MDTLLLPGQPIPLPSRAPVPQIGPGIYQRNGQLRASLLGTPHLQGSVRTLFCIVSQFSLLFVDFDDITNQTLPPFTGVHCYRLRYATLTVTSININYHC